MKPEKNNVKISDDCIDTFIHMYKIQVTFILTELLSDPCTMTNGSVTEEIFLNKVETFHDRSEWTRTIHTTELAEPSLQGYGSGFSFNLTHEDLFHDANHLNGSCFKSFEI